MKVLLKKNFLVLILFLLVASLEFAPRVYTNFYTKQLKDICSGMWNSVAYNFKEMTRAQKDYDFYASARSFITDSKNEWNTKTWSGYGCVESKYNHRAANELEELRVFEAKIDLWWSQLKKGVKTERPLIPWNKISGMKSICEAPSILKLEFHPHCLIIWTR